MRGMGQRSPPKVACFAGRSSGRSRHSIAPGVSPGQPGEGSDLPESYRLDREAPMLQGVPVASTASSR